jgi:Tfp pilus assembly protein FimT
MNSKLSCYYRQGVTLIEAIAVILLLSAAAATSMIYLDNDFLSRRTASAATIQVGEVLVLARNTAISHQTNVHVSRGLTQLKIHQEAGPVQAERTWLIDLPAGTKIDGSATDIIFKPVGSANRDLSWGVHHGDVYGKVSVTPISGNVRWSTP